MARTNTEIVSLLPVYQAKRSKDFSAWAIVTCPRDDCGEVFLVKITPWFKERTTRQGTVITGRSCPYCFRPSLLPARRAIR